MINALFPSSRGMATRPGGASAQDRLFGLVELMSRYANARLDGYESTRLAAAIVGHLRALADAIPDAPQVHQDANHWLEQWEYIMARQQVMQRQSAAHSLLNLLAHYGGRP
jgi:hypothetical protein